MKKIISFLTVVVILLLTCSSVFATNININTEQEENNTNTTSNTIESSKSILELISKDVCEINLNDMGNFKKELVEFDSHEKELTIKLSVTNTMKQEELTNPIEVFFVLDNSESMEELYQDKAKMEYVKETAKAFANGLFNAFTSPKIGIIGFSSIDPISDTSSTLGSLDDAKLLLPLSYSKENIQSTIDSYSENHGPYTNIEAGLELAQANFSENANTQKYIILISDGIPNLSLDTEHTLTYSGTNATNTKNKLIELGQAENYHLYSILMSSNESSTENPNAPTIEDGSRHMTYGELAEEIFGTVQNPTAGKFYYDDYENLSDILNNDILNSMITVKDNSLKNIVIKDYFPQEIVDNFNFEYVEEPNIGTVTEEISSEDNSITWKIDVLEEEQVATLSYKLSLKDKYNEAIVDKILPTNEKVDITFETEEGKGSSSSDVSPTIRLSYDDTTYDKNIPQTGNYITFYIVTAVIILGIFAGIKLHSYNKLK